MVETIVVDASAAIRAAAEHQEGHADALECVTRIAAAGIDLVAPELFFFEVGSAVSRAKFPEKRRATALLATFELVEARRPSLAAFTEAITLAHERRLSYYDATYLALARANSTRRCGRKTRPS